MRGSYRREGTVSKRTCAGCGTGMHPLRMEGKVIDLCPGCSSMWFDSGELAGTSRLSIPEHKLRGRASSVGPRQCPGCGREMNVLEAHPGSDILVETCPQCMGFFLDRGEYDRLKELYGPAQPTRPRGAAAARLSQPDESEVPEGPGISIDGDSVGWTIFQYVTGLPLEADTRQALFSPAVTGLILVNLMVFVAALIVGFREAMLSMALVPREILDGERLHTLLTSMFAHAGPFHLIGNMWFLFVCGDNTEHRLGLGQFLAMYFLAGLAATTVHIASMPGSQVPALGASGAISGVLGAYMVLFPGRRFLVRFFWFLWFHPITLRIPAWAYLGFWLVLQFLFVFLDAEGVAWWAHIGGFAVGAAWAYAFRAVRSTTEAAPARLT